MGGVYLRALRRGHGKEDGGASAAIRAGGQSVSRGDHFCARGICYGSFTGFGLLACLRACLLLREVRSGIFNYSVIACPFFSFSFFVLRGWLASVGRAIFFIMDVREGGGVGDGLREERMKRDGMEGWTGGVSD